MKIGIKVKPNLYDVLCGAEDLIRASKRTQGVEFRSTAQDAGHYDYCAVGAIMEVTAGGLSMEYVLDKLRSAGVTDAVQLLYFAIPKERRFRDKRKYVCGGYQQRRLEHVFMYNDQSSREQILEWFNRAKACA